MPAWPLKKKKNWAVDHSFIGTERIYASRQYLKPCLSSTRICLPRTEFQNILAKSFRNKIIRILM